MAVTREQVFSALFALTQGITWEATPGSGVPVGFKKTSRQITLFSDVPAAQQPWIGQAEHSEDSQQTTGMPYKRVWDAQWMVYHRASDTPGVIPSVFTNQIIDAIEIALRPKPRDPGFLDKRNTLSGLVYHCFIQGRVFKDPGDIDKQGLIVVPIKLLVP